MINLSSIRVRFISSFTTNILRAIISFFIGILIARMLGPSEYGSFNFLIGSFISIATFIDFATSSAFYTLISEKQRGRIFYLSYFAWLFSQFIFLILLVVLAPVSIREKIWLGYPYDLVLLALLTSFLMNQIWTAIGQIGESIRDTVGVQVRNLLIAILMLIGLLFLEKIKLITILNIFVLYIILYVIFSILYIFRIHQKSVFSHIDSETFADIVNNFRKFCRPLVWYTIIGFIYSFADLWILNKYGGSAQQGYYSISVKFSSVSLIATTSILQIYWKEVAEANSQNNKLRIATLYRQFSKGLFYLGALISGWIIVNSVEIIEEFLGKSYQLATIPFGLMSLYTVHQSMGQITGATLFAMGKTKIASIIGIAFMFISIPLTYLFLAPSNLIVPGLGLGSMGLALKMVICQIIGVNISAYFVSKYLIVKYEWKYQFYIIVIQLVFATISKYLSHYISTAFDLSIVYNLTISGILSLVFSIYFIIRYPSVIGLENIQLSNLVKKIFH